MEIKLRRPTPSTRQDKLVAFHTARTISKRGVAERRARERRGAREVRLDPRRRRRRDADDGLAGARPRVAVRVEALEEAVRAARRGGDGALVEVMRQRRLQLPLVVAQLSLCDVRFEAGDVLQLFDELLLLARLGAHIEGGSCGDRAGSIDDLFCELLYVVSGPLPPCATRRLSRSCRRFGLDDGRLIWLAGI